MSATTIDERLLERACKLAAALRRHPGRITEHELEVAVEAMTCDGKPRVTLDAVREYAQAHGWLR